MKTYTIPIKKSSIKLNPDYGSNGVQNIHTGTSVELMASGRGRYPEKIDDFLMVSATVRDGHCSAKYVGLQEIDVDKTKRLFKKHGLDVTSISVSFQHQQIHSMTLPSKYLFDYSSKKVTCKHCKSSFDYTKLETDYQASDDCDCYDDVSIDNICPICKKEDCCEIKYEKFSKEEYEK